MIWFTRLRPPGCGFPLDRIAGIVGHWLLGGATLCWVAANVGPQTGTAIVHVTEPDVMVTVGGVAFNIEDFIHAPIVCELPAGTHELTMRRGATLLHSESFSLRGGEERVLAAWDSSKPAPARACRRSATPPATEAETE
jgi:hypothetical protein